MDIYFTLTNYPGGLDALAGEIQLRAGRGLVREGLGKIADKFATVAHMGPKFMADFEDVQDTEDRATGMRDAFEKVDYLLRSLKIRQVDTGQRPKQAALKALCEAGDALVISEIPASLDTMFENVAKFAPPILSFLVEIVAG